MQFPKVKDSSAKSYNIMRFLTEYKQNMIHLYHNEMTLRLNTILGYHSYVPIFALLVCVSEISTLLTKQVPILYLSSLKEVFD